MNIHVIGDIHDKWNTVFDRLERYDIMDVILICVGDVGIGFRDNSRKEHRFLGFLNNRFKKRGIKFMAIRGNHDNPAYFDGSVKLSNIHLLPDYTTFENEGEKFLLVGGAVSVDRKENKENVDWWPNEKFVLRPELATPCDVLITHSGPSWIGPNVKSGIQSWIENDPTLWDECMAERKLHEELYELCKPSTWYCGHFHRSEWTDVNGCKARILDIFEIHDHNAY